MVDSLEPNREGIGGDAGKVRGIASADHQLELLVVLAVRHNLQIEANVRIYFQVVIHGLEKNLRLIAVVEPEHRKSYIFLGCIFFGSCCKEGHGGKQHEHQCYT